MAQGNTEKLMKAKKFALRLVIGIVVAAAASGGISMLLNTLNEVAVKTGSNINTTQTTKLQKDETCLGVGEAKCADGLTCQGVNGATLAQNATGTCQ